MDLSLERGNQLKARTRGQAVKLDFAPSLPADVVEGDQV